MTFHLIRIGWPNTAAILALALMPMVAFTTAPGGHAAAVHTERIEPAANCLALTECAAIAAAGAPETILQ